MSGLSPLSGVKRDFDSLLSSNPPHTVSMDLVLSQSHKSSNATPSFPLDQIEAVLNNCFPSEKVTNSGYLRNPDAANPLVGLAKEGDEKDSNLSLFQREMNYSTQPQIETVEKITTRSENKLNLSLKLLKLIDGIEKESHKSLIISALINNPDIEKLDFEHLSKILVLIQDNSNYMNSSFLTILFLMPNTHLTSIRINIRRQKADPLLFNSEFFAHIEKLIKLNQAPFLRSLLNGLLEPYLSRVNLDPILKMAYHHLWYHCTNQLSSEEVHGKIKTLYHVVLDSGKKRPTLEYNDEEIVRFVLNSMLRHADRSKQKEKLLQTYDKIKNRLTETNTIGKSIPLRSNLLHMGSSGHISMMQIEQDGDQTYSFAVFNSGEGAPLNEKLQSILNQFKTVKPEETEKKAELKKQYLEAKALINEQCCSIKYSKLTDKDLCNDFFEQLKLFNFSCPHYDQVFAYLEKQLNHGDNKSILSWHKLQKHESCFYKSISQYLHFTLGNEYRLFKVEMTQYLLDEIAALPPELKLPISREDLNEMLDEAKTVLKKRQAKATITI